VGGGIRSAVGSARLGLGGRAVAAIGINVAAALLTRLSVLLATFVLAHLLAPRDFGIANLGTMILAILLPFTDIGLAQALIRARPGEDLSRRAWTAFWLVILLGILLYAVVFAAADPVASFYGDPAIGPMLRVLALAIVVYSLSRIPSALLERGLLFGRKGIPDVVASLTYGVVAIALAAAGFGFWSIIVAVLVRTGVISALIFTVTRWRPGLRFELPIAVDLITYARVLMGNSLLRLAYTNVDNAVVGKVAGLPALGFYGLAYSLGNLPAVQLAQPVGAVLFPLYAGMLPDRARAREAAIRVLRYLSLLVSPAVSLSMVASPSLVPLALGEKWGPMTVALQVLLVYGWARTLTPVYSQLMLAADLNAITLRINFASLVVALAAAGPVARAYGFTGIAVEFTMLEILRLLATGFVVRLKFDLSLATQLRAVLPALGSSAAAGFAFVGLEWVWAPSNLVVIAAELLLAGLVCTGILFATGGLTLSEIAGVRRVLSNRGR